MQNSLEKFHDLCLCYPELLERNLNNAIREYGISYGIELL